MSEVTLRRAGVEDAGALGLVGAATFLETYAGLVPGGAIVAHCARVHTAVAYRGYMGREETRVWIATVEPDGAPVGYGMVMAPDFPAEMVRGGDVELRRIYLLSRFHGSGVGRRMMEAALGEARAMGARRVLLGHHPENVRARAFYEKSGFERVGERRFVVGGVEFVDPVLGLEL